MKIKPPVPKSIGEVPKFSVLANRLGDALKSTANISNTVPIRILTL